MAQQIQPNVGQTQPVIQQPVAKTTQPVEGQTQPEGMQTTSVWKKWWMLLIIALVAIGAGIGAYFLFLG